MIYLNSGSHSITPKPILDAVQRYQREYELNPTDGLFGAYDRLWRAQCRVAGFFGADPKDVFLRSNVTEVINEFILGLDAKFLPAGSAIAITDLEYGAIANLVRYRCERSGLKELAVQLPQTSAEITALTADKIADLILGQLTPNTRMLVCSDVITYNGLVLPIEKIARETRKRGILLIVDGAHGPGALDLDFKRFENVDFYGGNLHKWMMGPKGTSFGWVHPIHQDKIAPLMAGWTTYENPFIFQAFGGGSRFASRMLMVGCQDFAPFFALEDLIDYWEKTGPAKIRAELYERQADLEDKMRALALPPLSPPRGELRGPLLAYEVSPAVRAASMELPFSLLKDHGLQVVFPLMQGRAVLRLTTHIYNTPEEHARAVEILKKTIAS
jgi:isopenicillin-N epimerase